MHQVGLFYGQIFICQKQKKKKKIISAGKQSKIVDIALVLESSGLSSFLDVDNIIGFGKYIHLSPPPHPSCCRCEFHNSGLIC